MESGNGAPVRPQARASTSPENLRRSTNGRAEIDFSAPFGSVREAVVRFGGIAPAAARWRPAPMANLHFSPSEIELMKLEEQKVKIEMYLYIKEKETFDVLKELEMTESFAECLKLQLQKHMPQFGENQEVQSYTTRMHPNPLAEQKCPIYSKTCTSFESQNKGKIQSRSPGLILLELIQAKANLNTTTNGLAGFHSNIELLKSQPIFSETQPSPACQNDEGKSQSPGLILMELKQAKTNLNTTTTGLAGFRTNIELLKSKISEEKALLEKTREKLKSNTAKMASLEEELGRESLRLNVVKNSGFKGSGRSLDTLSQIRLLNFEKEKHIKMVEALKLEVCELIAVIEQAKCKTKAAEVRWIAAKRMEAASRSAEAVALAEIKTRRAGKKSNSAIQTASTFELSIMEHMVLMRGSQGVDEASKRKLESAMRELKEAQQSKLEALEKVEEATADVETSRKVLEEALKREEEANKGKNAVEEALSKLKSQRCNRTWSSENISKFKNSAISHRRPTRLLDVNGLSLVTVGSSSSSGTTLSIGQILSTKLIDSDDYETRALQKIDGRPRVSLRQILSKNQELFSSPRIVDGGARKRFSMRRKKFGFVALTFLLARQRRKKQANA